MLFTLKTMCLAIYALALVGLAGVLPHGLATATQALALLFLVVHVLEVIFMFRYVRLYSGSSAMSVFLTLLFGLLHWKPLANAQTRAKSGAAQVSSA